MSMSRLAVLAGVAGAVFAGSSAPAQQVLQADRLAPNGTVAVQLGFVNGEIGAVTFIIPPALLPARVTGAQIFWRSGQGLSTNSIQDAILVYRGIPGQPGFSLLYESDPPQLTDGFLNQFELPDGPVIQPAVSGPTYATVGLRFNDAAGGRFSEASIVSDNLGCLGNTSFVYDVIFNQWRSFCFYGGNGVFVIRAIVEKYVAPCVADFNTDRVVDDSDFVIFAQSYNLFTVPPADPACDLNDDGQVDDVDFVLFAQAYDRFSCP